MTGRVTIVFTGSGTAGRSGHEPGAYIIYLVEEWKVGAPSGSGENVARTLLDD